MNLIDDKIDLNTDINAVAVSEPEANERGGLSNREKNTYFFET